MIQVTSDHAFQLAAAAFAAVPRLALAAPLVGTSLLLLAVYSALRCAARNASVFFHASAAASGL